MVEVAPRTGIEPVAYGLGNRRSVQLSYRGIVLLGCLNPHYMGSSSPYKRIQEHFELQGLSAG